MSAMIEFFNCQIVFGAPIFCRLWCVIELFVFLEMGGSPENLVARIFKKMSFKCVTLSAYLDTLQCFAFASRKLLSCPIQRSELPKKFATLNRQS